MNPLKHRRKKHRHKQRDAAAATALAGREVFIVIDGEIQNLFVFSRKEAAYAYLVKYAPTTGGFGLQPDVLIKPVYASVDQAPAPASGTL